MEIMTEIIINRTQNYHDFSLKNQRVKLKKEEF
jgi:hypothetical protein